MTAAGWANVVVAAVGVLVAAPGAVVAWRRLLRERRSRHRAEPRSSSPAVAPMVLTVLGAGLVWVFDLVLVGAVLVTTGQAVNAGVGARDLRQFGGSSWHFWVSSLVAVAGLVAIVIAALAGFPWGVVPR